MKRLLGLTQLEVIKLCCKDGRRQSRRVSNTLDRLVDLKHLCELKIGSTSLGSADVARMVCLAGLTRLDLRDVLLLGPPGSQLGGLF